MKKFWKLALFGFLSWLFIFIAAVCLLPLKPLHRLLFENLVVIGVIISTVFFTILYFRKVQAAFLREGLLLGVAFLVVNFVCDLGVAMGPMKMSFADYAIEIGLTYLNMPIVALGFGYSLRGHELRNPV